MSEITKKIIFLSKLIVQENQKSTVFHKNKTGVKTVRRIYKLRPSIKETYITSQKQK